MARRKIALSAALDLGALAVALAVASIIAFGTPWPWFFRENPSALVASLSFGAEIVDAQWAPDGRQVAVAAMNGEVGGFGVTPGALA